MKIHKKIGFVLAIIFGVFLTLFLPDKTFAASPSPTFKDAERCEQKLRVVNIGTIECETPDGKEVFIDIEPTDADSDDSCGIIESSVVECTHVVNWSSLGSSYFCDPGRFSDAGFFSPSQYGYLQGITARDESNHKLTLADAGKRMHVKMNIGYKKDGSTGCERYGGSDGKTTYIEDTSGLRFWFEFNEDSITSFDGVTKGELGGKNYQIITGYEPSQPTSGVFAGDNYTECEGEILLVKNNNETANAKAYKLKKGGLQSSEYPDLYNFMTKNSVVGCGVDSVNFERADKDESFGIAGKRPDNSKPRETVDPSNLGKTPGVTGDDEACYSSGWALSWVACPVITVAQTLANEMYEFVENQLKFTVSPDGKTKDSLGDQKTREDVKSAWNNFRILVSGLVVILMLVMVISQAIGTGPFDAYTVRKMLPRLVAGVILIQLSWPIFAWVINSVDDLGRGLADIIYAPFGGANELNLNKVMEPFVGPGVIAFNWFGVVGIVALGVVAPFLILGLILTVLVAVFAGFLALLFRKILIILALITVPVALIAWMMPNEGLRRYWKLWWDNFLKALMMFPLIILIIAAGRIFAKIGGGQEDNLVGFFIVLVGFFGPLFILPKTFKWGGTVMSLAGNALQKAQERSMKKPQEYLKKQQEGYSALRDARSSFRYNNPNEYRKSAWARTASLWRRPIDTFKAGGLNPLLGLPGSELRARQRAAFVARGDKYEREQREEAAILREKVENRLDEGRVEGGIEGGNKDDMYQDMLKIARGEAPVKLYFDTAGREMNLRRLMGRGQRARDIMRRAAADRMVELGAGTNWRHIEAEHERINTSGTAQERTAWRKFLNDNKTVILEKMPDLLKGVGSVSDISAEGISRMHGIGIERMLSKTHADATEGIRAGETQPQFTERQRTGQARLEKFLTTYNEALNNNNLRGNLEQNGLRAVKAFVAANPNDRYQILLDPDSPARVHSDREDGRQQITATTVASDNPVGSGGTAYVGEPLLDPVVGTYADGSLIDVAAQTPGARSSAEAVATLPQALRNALDSEINVDGSFHAPTRRGAATTDRRAEWFVQATDFQIANLAHQVGGYNQLDNIDLQHIYNNKSGALKTAAETELRNRGLIP